MYIYYIYILYMLNIETLLGSKICYASLQVAGKSGQNTMRLFSHKNRPPHLGPYPSERLPRGPIGDLSIGRLPPEGESSPLMREALQPYREICARLAEGDVAPPASLPNDPLLLGQHLKAAAYFLDAAQAGVCRHNGQSVLVVLAAAPPPLPQSDFAESEVAMAATRAGEIAAVLANYLRRMGVNAVAVLPWQDDGRLAAWTWAAGLAALDDRGLLVNPFLGAGYAAAAVMMDLALAADQPLARCAARLRPWSLGLAAALGVGGARPFWRWRWPAAGMLETGPYPMAGFKRVVRPTTRIDTDRVPRVPKRAAFFARARAGDLGDKAQREVARFAYKTPLADAMMPLIKAMVPHQDGPVAAVSGAARAPDDNRRWLRVLAHALGSDMVGMATVPDYAWFSHHADGAPITPYHRYAVVILIDQGFETMEGASGDDWISGAQSMRAYMRGAEIAGIVAAAIRAKGYSARSQTNADSDVLHIPLILEAGLGELSRIGELVLNPLVGPRFKSVVVTTDMPMTVDRPIDFGLQDFCNQCLKCARECPCHAISFGPKIMFNGYAMWKPDAEKCARYRITNAKGSACGRCMKTCPFNTEGLLAHRLFLWLAVHIPWTRRWIAILDDKVGNGRRNGVKKWWFDLELIDGRAVPPKAGTNARDLDFSGVLKPQEQKIAIYPADMMPAPDARTPHPVDRAEGLRRSANAEVVKD